MLEKRFIAVSPQLFTADGETNGTITVVDSRLFKVKQEIILNASTVPTLELEIKRIDNLNKITVGPRGANIGTVTDVSAFTVALGANIFANEQKRPSIPFEESTRAVYEEEPTVALRTVLVDGLGNKIDSANPLPVQVDTTVNIGDVRITAADNDPNPGNVHSSVRISDGTDEANIFNNGALSVRPDNKLIDLPHDTLQVLSQTTAGDPLVIAVKQGGLAGTTVRTLTLAYDAAGNIQSVVRT